MKTIKIIIPVLFIILSLNSCNFWMGSNSSIERHGHVTDTNGVAIPNVKLTVLVADDYTGYGEETEFVYFTDESGYYELEFEHNSDKTYRLKPTHDNYIYPLISSGKYYPHINTVGEKNFEMVKLGKVKIEGLIMCDGNDPYFIPNVKMSILKRKLEGTDYPDTTGVYTYTDDNGEYYLEYEGDENYEFFIKPEKDGFFYEWREFDYAPAPNTDPGYITSGSIKIEKED